MTGATRRATTARPARAALAQIALVAGAGLAIALARRYADFHLGFPGHTGLLWMLVLVLARARVSLRAGGVFLSVSAALWGQGLGAPQTLPYNLLLNGSVGVVLDAVTALPFVRLAHPLGGLLAGGLAHAAKFAFILVHAEVLGLHKNFFLAGVVESFGYHFAFGAAGGLAAGVLLLATRPGAIRR